VIKTICYKLEAQMITRSGSSFFQRPSTQFGWWAVGLALVFVTMFIIILLAPLPFSELPKWIYYTYFIFLSLCGLAAGIVGLLAVIQKHDHSWIIWLAILSGAVVFLSFH
jgi:hypothetical protein